MRDRLLRIIIRWETWTGQCGSSLPIDLGGLTWSCTTAVGRFRYALTGCCKHCRREGAVAP